MVLTLLEHGADVTGKDASRPPLEVAAKKGAADIGCRACRLKHGADVKRRSGGETPLAQAAIDRAHDPRRIGPGSCGPYRSCSITALMPEPFNCGQPTRQRLPTCCSPTAPT